MEPLSIAVLIVVLASLTTAWIRRIPMVMAITVANFLVFTAMLFSEGLADQGVFHDLATRVSYLVDRDYAQWYTILTSTFLHAGFVHIFGNMLVLVMLGLPFEERVGPLRFTLIYFLSAVVAVLLHAIWIYYQDPSPGALEIPLVGASGAVFGILGAFATMYPRDRVPMFLIFIFLPRVPVYVGAIAMTAVEIFALGFGAQGNVAHAAHIGGAVGGFILGLSLKPKRERAEEERPQPVQLDYGVLESLAHDPQQKQWLRKLKENEDERETQDAWLQQLLPTLECQECGSALAPHGRRRLRCANRHEVTYAK